MPIKAKQVDAKDPGESKTYTMDWSGVLNSGATISTSVWSVQSGLTNAADSTSGAKTTIRLSGGSDGTDYLVTNTITTSDSETLIEAAIVPVRKKTGR